MDLPEIRQLIKELQAKRGDIEHLCINTRSKMEAGSIITKYTACKKGGCKCTRGELHGPFVYLSQRIDGKTKNRYVGKETDKEIVKKVKAYMQYQDRLAELRKITKEIDDLYNQYREILIKKGQE